MSAALSTADAVPSIACAAAAATTSGNTSCPQQGLMPVKAEGVLVERQNGPKGARAFVLAWLIRLDYNVDICIAAALQRLLLAAGFAAAEPTAAAAAEPAAAARLGAFADFVL